MRVDSSYPSYPGGSTSRGSLAGTQKRLTAASTDEAGTCAWERPRHDQLTALAGGPHRVYMTKGMRTFINRPEA